MYGQLLKSTLIWTEIGVKNQLELMSNNML